MIDAASRSRTAICALLLALGCPPASTAAETPVLTVSTIAPRSERWPAVVHADGGLAPWQEVVVGSEVGGLRLTAVLVDVGDAVRKDQELAALDRTGVTAELDQALAAEAEAVANLELAKADAARAESLRGTGVLSEQQIAQYRIAARTAEARLSSTRAQVAGIRVRLAQTVITAADDGVVSSRTAALGSVVQPGGELFRLVRRGRIEWRAEVSDRELLLIRPGQTASLRLPGGATATGTVRAVAPVLDSQRRTGLVYVDVASDGARAGMFASGELLAGEPQAVLTVPQEVLLVRDGYSLVFRVGDDGRAVATRVATGRRLEGRVEISDGLTPGARVVAAGAAFLNDGDRVAVTP